MSAVLRLASRPSGPARIDNFTVCDEPLPPLAQGEARIRTFLLSVDPTLRIWMSDQPQYLPPVELGAVMRCAGLGVVEESLSEGLPVGAVVTGLVNWREQFIARSGEVTVLPVIPGVAWREWLGALGMTGGLTAFFGLEHLKLKAGETVVVTGAAGSVGSLVGQLARLAGCRVIGVAGGPAKCERVVSRYGFDGCVDYKSGDVAAALDKLCPDGIDAVFENVGGPVLNQLMLRMNNFSRIAICGLISQYDLDRAPGPWAFPMILMRRITVQGFIILDSIPRFGEALGQLIPLVTSGALKADYHEISGSLPGVVDALNLMLGGGNEGKTLYRLGPDPV
jgi:hypothetical protein